MGKPKPSWISQVLNDTKKKDWDSSQTTWPPTCIKHKRFLEVENIICMKTGVASYFISIFNFILDFLPELLVKM